jgi:hypothetical protein
MTKSSYARVALLVAAFFVLLGPRSALPQEDRTTEQREHAAAWGAHHLCSGLYVVGRDHQRDPETVVAQDIARRSKSAICSI